MSLCIKYNPLKTETVIEFDGEALSSNSEYFVGDKTISQWIYTLPKMILEEWGTKKVHIEFEGSDYDYNLLQQVITKANESGYKLTSNHCGGKNKRQFSIDNFIKELSEINLSLEERTKIGNAINEIENNKIKIALVGDVKGRASVINALLKGKFVPEDCDKNIVINHIDKNIYSAEIELVDGKKAKYDNFGSSTMFRISNNINVKTVDIEGRVAFWESNMGDFTIYSITMDNISEKSDEIDNADVIVCVVDDFENHNTKVNVKKLAEVNSNIVMVVGDEDAWLDYAKENTLPVITWCLNDNVGNLDKVILDYIRENTLNKSLKNKIVNAQTILENIKKAHENSLQALYKRQSMISVNIDEAKMPFEEKRSLVHKIQNGLETLAHNSISELIGDADDTEWNKTKNVSLKRKFWELASEKFVVWGTLQSKAIYIPDDEYGSVGVKLRELSDYTESTEWFSVMIYKLLNDNIVLRALLENKYTLYALVKGRWEDYCDDNCNMAVEFCKRNYTAKLWGEPKQVNQARSYYNKFKVCEENVDALVKNLKNIFVSTDNDDIDIKTILLKNFGRVLLCKYNIDKFRTELEESFLEYRRALIKKRLLEKINVINNYMLIKEINNAIGKLNDSRITKMEVTTSAVGNKYDYQQFNTQVLFDNYQCYDVVKISFDLVKAENAEPAMLCKETYRENAYIDIYALQSIVDWCIKLTVEILDDVMVYINDCISNYIDNYRYTIQNELDSYLKALTVKEKSISEQEKLLREKDLEVSNEKVIINKLSELEKKLDAIVNF